MQMPSKKEVFKLVLQALFVELVFVVINVTIHTNFIASQPFLSPDFWIDVRRMALIALPGSVALFVKLRWCSMTYFFGYFISHIVSLYNDRANGILDKILHESGMMRTYIIICAAILGLIIEFCIFQYKDGKKRKAARKLREERNAAMKLGAASDGVDVYGSI